MMKFIVTGGRGFIGSHFVELVLKNGDTVIDIDKMTYASHLKLPWDDNKNYRHINKDICDIDHLESCDYLVNFAAESHVDNSINSSKVFLNSNVVGVHNLLELIRGKPAHSRPIFMQISTDEVYGDILQGEFKEEDRLLPSNPYSATKAAAEMLVLSYGRTYGIEYVISRSGNNYGSRQFEEKLISKSIECAKTGKDIPLHGDGSYVRDWTYVKDNVDGIHEIIKAGVVNEIFNVASGNYMTNLNVAKIILSWFDRPSSQIRFVENRWGQDTRYALDCSKLKSLGWSPLHPTGLFRWFDE